MRLTLDRMLPSWKGMSRVRVIHGQGTALTPTVLQWCRERGIPYETERDNPGSTLLFPNQRPQAEESFGTVLRERMPEQLQNLRFTPSSPEERLRAEQEQRRRELARKE